MKSLKTITFATGVLVVAATLSFLSTEITSRNDTILIDSLALGTSGLFALEDCSISRPAVELGENGKTGAGTGQIYFWALHVAALIGLGNEKTSRNETAPINNTGFAVVELFTSEGCSSCPPADELVKSIQQDDRTGKVYVLAFHVDYWDHQGWKDKFSEKEFSNRQIQYAAWLNLQTIYTPQIVVNGSTEHVGSDKRAILKAISKGLTQEAPTKLEMNAWMEDDQIRVEYQTVIDGQDSELVLALVQKSAQVDVMAGENMGRSLSHVQIVRKISRLALDLNSKRVTTIKPPVDFSKNGWEIIGFVQSKSNGIITSARRFDFE